ncbi:MAG: Cof-type HAD-IIB family hydrolase [Eubacteriales bacterium]|nr:Cof-type HAD-IIB family hydrolase [Eubacteriales bacterium]
MSTNSKIIFLDLDGTLYDDDKHVSVENRRALNEALAAGHKVAITTGRPLPSALRLADELQLNGDGCYIIAYNGGLSYDPYRKKLMSITGIPLSRVVELMHRANDFGLHAQTYSDTSVVSEFENEDLHRYCKKTKMPFEIVSDVTEALGSDYTPCKALVICYESHEKLDAFKADVTSWCEGTLEMVYSCPEYLEFMPAGVNKGHAVRMLAKELGIPMENTVAAGDAENDIEMLNTAHVGALMCNALESMKGVGNYVTTRDNNHDGVAEIIDRFLLNK